MADTASHTASHLAPSRAPGLALGTRWLGVGLASIVAVITLSLAVTGRIGLYINPDAAWWAVSMSVVVLVGAVASSMIPVQAHEHDLGDEHEHEHEDVHEHEYAPGRIETAVIAVGGAAASVFVVTALVLPPASLSTELALARASGAPPQLATSATLTLASTGDTSTFGIGEWSSIIATTTDPAGFAGETATLTGFVGPADRDDEFWLTRLVIVHCVIDAQAASIPVADAAWGDRLAVGEWVEVTGTFVQDPDGSLVFEPASVVSVDEPGDPYEY